MLPTLLVLVLQSLLFVFGGIYPTHYDILLEPNFENLSFNGATNILIELVIETDCIVVDAKRLEFYEIALYNSGAEVPISNFSLEYDQLVVNLCNKIEPGSYKLITSYKGTLNNNPEGFYVAQYSNASAGQIRRFALINLHYKSAKLVFPCFDGPNYRATFTLRIVRPNSYVALSNTKLNTSEEIKDDKTMDVFETTKLMPPFMLSFAIVDFNNTIFDQFVLYHWTGAGIVYTMNVIKQVAATLEGFHSQIREPPVHIVVPDQFLAEKLLVNPGIILYRESAVSFTDGRSTTKEKQSVLNALSYALSKEQLMTLNPPTRWSDFWIFEGIATFYQYEISTRIEPSWRLLEQYAVVNLHDSLERDWGENARALSSPPVNDDSYIALFRDSVFHVKSGAVAMMFCSSPHETCDIVSDTHYWNTNLGFPLVNVWKNYTTGVLTLTQEAFLAANYTELWRIPINLTSIEQYNILIILENKTQSIDAANTSTLWYLTSFSRPAYFRTNYDTETWTRIITILQKNFTSIAPVDRAQLIDDSFNLAHSGYISLEIYLNLISYVAREEDFMPLRAFFKTTTKLKNLLCDTDIHQKFLTFSTDLLQELYRKLGTNINPFESHSSRINRIQVLKWLCDFGDPSCQEEMFEVLSSFQSVHPDMEEAAYCGGMRLGGLSHFLFLATHYQMVGKEHILMGMGCTSDTLVLSYYLQAILDESLVLQIKPAHKLKAFSAIYQGSDVGPHLALDFLRDNFRKMLKSFTDDQISEMIKGLSGKLFSQEQDAKISLIISNITEEDDSKYLEWFSAARRQLRLNMEWRDLYLDVINHWFDNLEDNFRTTTESPSASTSTLSVAPSTLSTTTKSPDTNKPNGNGGVPFFVSSTALLINLLSVFVLI